MSNQASTLKITGPSGIEGAARSDIEVPENKLEIYTCTANKPVTWSIITVGGGASEEVDFFTIDSKTGVLKFKSAPDYENPQDEKGANNYDFYIQATDNSGNKVRQWVEIVVTDVDEFTYTASVNSPSITETDFGTKTLAFTITLDQAVSEKTNINYQTLTSGTATTREDFVSAAGVVTFVKGQKVATLNISVNGDAEVEDDETIKVKFSSAALKDEVIATGTIKNNDIVGTDSDDTINGTTDNDNIKGGGGSDVIDGGAGDDTITYTGKFNDYTITKTTTTIQITDIRVTSPDGVDTVQNIEYVQFTDQLVAADKVNVVKTFSGNFKDYKFYNKGNGNYEIKSSTGTIDVITGIPKLTFDDKTADKSVSAIADIKGVFDQITGLNTNSGKMFRLYNAAFARFPDASGLEYWISQRNSEANSERVIAQSFLASTEFSESYGNNLSNESFVNTLYKNVLNRDPDIWGFHYWLGQLSSGEETRYEALLGFAESGENKDLFTEMTGFG
tara:strand:+ start:181 stop:1695 length:1515 start_codon:yes stop_codon:yes gene_type:complete